MTSEYPQIREFVLRALAQHGASSDSTHIASAFDVLCERLRARLQPLFGKAATEALFGRALQVATAEFSWLGALIPRGTEQCAPDELARLRDQLNEDELRRGLAAVLAYDIALLSEFVGSDLVMPLVQEAWSLGAGDNGRE
jgi:hypothetical protein